jgi:uncharacterized protein YgbK (DUF1537 family)
VIAAPSLAPVIGVLADDLTGALASAARLRRAGLSADVTWELSDSLSGSDAIVVDMRTRDWNDHDPAQRARMWAEILCARSCPRLELRIDSTLRGSPADELRGLREGARFDDAITLVVAAHPEAGRVTVGGTQRATVGAARLEVDVAERILPGRAVASISLEDVEAGHERVCAWIATERERGISDFVADATDVRHLRELALAARALESAGTQIVSVSPGGWLAFGPVVRRSDLDVVVVVIASAADTTHEQVHLLRMRGHRCIEPDDADQLVLDEDERVVVVTHFDGDEGERAAESAAHAAGVVLRRIRERGGHCRAVVATGGHTASCLADALGARSIRARGELAPLVPRGTLQGGPYDGLGIVTKGGLIGDAKTLEHVVDRLVGEDANG